MTEVFDLSDPANPVKIRDFGLVGQEPGATGPIPTELHGPISLGPAANRIYFGYGTNKGTDVDNWHAVRDADPKLV